MSPGTSLSLSFAIHSVVLAIVSLGLGVAPSAPQRLDVVIVPPPASVAVAGEAASRQSRPQRGARVAAAAPATLAAPADASSGGNAASSMADIPRPDAPVGVPVPVPVSPPRYDAGYLDNPAPAYPAVARRRRIEGLVMLDVMVGADGRPTSVDVAATSGEEQLDRAALDAVRTWRFVPARRGSEAVAGHVRVPMRFRLDG